MPIAFGLMRFGRINIHPTTIKLDTTEDHLYANCSDGLPTMTITIGAVVQAGLSNVRPGGSVTVKRISDGYVLGTGKLLAAGSNSSHITLPLFLGASNTNLKVYYNRTTNDFIVNDASNANPIKISTAAHNLLTGHIVTISGALGNTAANGTWTITVVDGTSFTLDGSTGNGAYTAYSATVSGPSFEACSSDIINYSIMPTGTTTTIVSIIPSIFAIINGGSTVITSTVSPATDGYITYTAYTVNRSSFILGTGTVTAGASAFSILKSSFPYDTVPQIIKGVFGGHNCYSASISDGYSIYVTVD